MIEIEEKNIVVNVIEECIDVIAVETETKVIEVNTSIPGPKGQDGKDGIDGKDGEKGQDGTNATINGYSTVSIEAGDNITIDQEEDTLTISASGGEQVQSDLGQEDETAVDFVKGKRAENLAVYYVDEETGDEEYMMSVYEFLWMLVDMNSSVSDEVSNKQSKLVDLDLTILIDDWTLNFSTNMYEVTLYSTGVQYGDLIWYSPTYESMNDFVKYEIILKENQYGNLLFQASDKPSVDIPITVRRCPKW